MLAERGLVSPQAAHNLQAVIAIATASRMKIYLSSGGQKEFATTNPVGDNQEKAPASLPANALCCFGLVCFGLVWIGLVWFALDWFG